MRRFGERHVQKEWAAGRAVTTRGEERSRLGKTKALPWPQVGASRALPCPGDPQPVQMALGPLGGPGQVLHSPKSVCPHNTGVGPSAVGSKPP